MLNKCCDYEGQMWIHFFAFFRIIVSVWVSFGGCGAFPQQHIMQIEQFHSLSRCKLNRCLKYEHRHSLANRQQHSSIADLLCCDC